MKIRKFILLACILLGVHFFCNSESFESSYLKEFFDTNDFKTDLYKIDDSDLYFSYIYSEKSNDKISKGIVYFLVDENIQWVLKIDNEKIYNSEELLFNGIAPNQDFYGYSIKINPKGKSIATTFYTDGGKKVTDGPIFHWNSSKKIFYKYKIDPKMY